VGNSCLGSAYTTANQVPNIIYDIVLGGALATIMVPVLAGPADRSGTDPEAARVTRQISSALLTWTVVLLVPASAILALAAHPVVSLLIPRLQGCARPEAILVASRMLVVFAPQILLYGLAVVLYGILQAHRRFTAPALAPVLSSLVVIAAYIAFVPLGGRHTAHLVGLPGTAELMLSVGTTAGVAALVLTAAVPAFRLRLRPALRFPNGVARRAGSLAMVGIAVLIAQDASAVVVTRLANGHGGNGAVVLYNYAWQMFLVPYAVLAIPIAVSAFPVLSARGNAELTHAEVDGAEFDATSAAATRGVLLVSWLGAALLAGAAVPAARLFASHPGQASHLALALAAFAPGLVGYGLLACLSRVLLADGRNRVAAGLHRRRLAGSYRGGRHRGRVGHRPLGGAGARPGQYHRPGRLGNRPARGGPVGPGRQSAPGHRARGGGRAGGRGGRRGRGRSDVGGRAGHRFPPERVHGPARVLPAR